MFNYIEGKLSEHNPACVTLDCGGVGYEIHVSLYTYDKIKDRERCKLYVYEAIREDAHLLFGFAEKQERDLFLQLISVSGVGANTARVILSTLSPQDTVNAVLSGDSKKIQSVKGIGLKTAQRIVVDLRDRLGKADFAVMPEGILPQPVQSVEKSEAVSALLTLGFAKPAVQKAVDSIWEKQPGLSTEDIIKQALRML